MEIFAIAGALWLVSAFAAGFLTAEVADSKGRNYNSWFVVGFLTGVLGLIAAAGLPDELAD